MPAPSHLPEPLPDLVQRTLPIAMLSLALISVPVLVLEPSGLPRLRGLEHELSDVSAQNEELRRDVTRLRVEVQDLRDNPEAIERIARGELGLVRQDEIVFQFAPSDPIAQPMPTSE
ncbi:MAG: FtsB family cell division protein [Polyangiaceae bacterium]